MVQGCLRPKGTLLMAFSSQGKPGVPGKPRPRQRPKPPPRQSIRPGLRPRTRGILRPVLTQSPKPKIKPSLTPRRGGQKVGTIINSDIFFYFRFVSFCLTEWLVGYAVLTLLNK